ncbi:hypothetical protein CA267_017690 [Alteromonas pelagimontana]|uniref:Uncharacterized protein n=1 Tax=Alteromonas pelagimontana TaxID=1858656 RepID=A0A6M4MIK2_9ALTE|nr:hypothetical protein [Alteromonas pelagimontana]QJR82455.1 hypothetical protein CA267_017690 [Alteromonas pelagimontana]
MGPIIVLEQLAQDVNASYENLTVAQQQEIAELKASAADINAIMAIVEPTDPNDPAPMPDDHPEKDPR